MKKLLFSLILFGYSSLSLSESLIGGDIGGSTLDKSGNPYIIEQDIIVPSGKKVIIKDGVVLLFKPFTGLQVHGSLSVDGTSSNPVIFTSINDEEFNKNSQQLPNPFDWNGILLSSESNSATFNNFYLRFSVYGLKSQNQFVKLKNGLFRQNGQFHFTMNDKIQFVQDNISYSYGVSAENEQAPGTKSPKKGSSKTFRYTTLGIGVVGIVGAAGFGLLANSNKKFIEDNNQIIKLKLAQGDYLGAKTVNEQSADKRKLYKQNSALAIVSGILGIIGIAGFTFTFYY